MPSLKQSPSRRRRSAQLKSASWNARRPRLSESAAVAFSLDPPDLSRQRQKLLWMRAADVVEEVRAAVETINGVTFRDGSTEVISAFVGGD